MMKRLYSVVANTGRSLATPGFSVLFSLVVIRYSSKAIWGTFVESMIVISLLAQLINWGNKEFLLRRFSRTPSTISNAYLGNFATRALLIIPAILPILLMAENYRITAWQIAWLIILFTYQSMEVLVVYYKKFAHQLLAEAAGFLLTITGIFLNSEALNAELIIRWYVIGLLAKQLVISAFFRNEISASKNIKIDWQFFKAGLPFLLIGISGMLQSKVDLYIVGIMLDKESLGIYQVILSLFIYIQAVAGFILTPFIKTFYRMNRESFRKVQKLFGIAGIPLCLAGVTIVYAIINWLYGFHLPPEIYVYGLLFAFPIFIYLPHIYHLYKHGMEKKVMVINFVASGVNAGLAFVLIRYFGIKGALMAATVTQCLMALYYIVHRKQLKHVIS